MKKRRTKPIAKATIVVPSAAGKPAILATKNLPKITIRSLTSPYGDIRITIPGFHRATIALAHSIVAAFLYEVNDSEWAGLLAPRVDPGDRLMTCTVVSIDPIHDSGKIPRATMTQLAIHARVATKRVCRRLSDGTPTHTIVVEEVA